MLTFADCVACVYTVEDGWVQVQEGPRVQHPVLGNCRARSGRLPLLLRRRVRLPDPGPQRARPQHAA